MPHTKKTTHSHISPPILGGIKGGKHGFTLVELIVVITIIAILGAIAFTAFNGFQSSARDSTRASDLANLSQGLDTSYVKTGSYPNPDNAFTVTYSGGSLWYQGTIGDTLINILSSAGSKFSKKPTDPLTPTKEYAYSRSAYGNTYELSSNWEGDRIAFKLPHLTSPKIGEEFAYFLSLPLFQGESEGVTNSLIPQAFASSGNPLITYIKGNYNGMVAKTITGSIIYVIATPSITTSLTGTADVTTLSGKLLYHGQTNSGGIAYTPTLIYSSGALPTNDTTGQITLLTTNLQAAYSGSVVSQNANISNVLTTTGATNITSLGANIITNYLGGTASVPPPPPATNYNISNSLMFDSASSQFLSRTPSVAGNQKKWTWSGWVKRGKLGTGGGIFFANNTNSFNYALNDWFGIRFAAASLDTLDIVHAVGGTVQGRLLTTQVFRDPSAYYHIIFTFDSDNTTSSDRMRLYVNGTRVVNFTTETYPSSGSLSWVNANTNFALGSFPLIGATPDPFDGYLADVNFVDSGALDPTAFGYADSTTNQWLPKAYTGTYGTNGFHLDFSSGALTSGSNVGLGKDSSGNGNYWNTNGFSDPVASQVIDTPLNNFATLNPIDNLTTGATLQEGSLKATTIVTGDQTIRSTMAISSGKWYWETKINTVGAGGSSVGIVPLSYSTGTQIGNTIDSYSYRHLGYKRTNTTDSAYGDAFTNNDIIGVAYDADNGKIFFRKGTTWQNSGDPVAGINPAFSGITGTYFPAISDTSGATSCSLTVNFGQRPFANPIPSGFKALSTANLPTPTIQNPKQYFDVLTYAGSSSAQTIAGLGFQPDFVWIKSRNLVNGLARDHDLTDSVRGVGKSLFSNLTTIEDSAGRLTALTSTGFSLGGGFANTNYLGGNYVAWNWKKGTTPGFDIVTYTGTAANTTIAHGLNAIPKMIIVKSRTGNRSWGVYHASVGNSGALYLDLTNATNVASFHWNNISPTSNTFSLGIGSVTNSAEPYIAYLWSEIPGFSKFGSYTGNGSDDGPFVYTGFRPRYVMIKGATAIANWTTWDTARDPFNTGTNDNTLFPNASSSEEVSSIYEAWDILSNGFKLRALGSRNNVSGVTYIYAAFAEAPFKYANAR